MKYPFRLSVLLLVLPLAACSIHPLPEDVQKYGTFDIVQHIRCEAQRSLQDNAIEFLEDNSKLDRSEADLAQDYALAEDLKLHRERFASIGLKYIPSSRAKLFYKKYINSAIAFNFTFDLLEKNENTAETDFAKLISNGTVSLKFSASANFERDSNRQFTISDKFSTLLTKTTCGGEQPGPNPIYPIAGSIGLHDTIRTFVRLNEEAILKDKSDGDPYSDQLMFTTTFSGTANPMITLNAVQRLGLSEAMINSTATRTDENKVIIGMALEPYEAGADKHHAVSPFDVGGSAQTKTAPTGAEARAIGAAYDNRVNSFLDGVSRSRLQ